MLAFSAVAANVLLMGSPWIETPLPGGLPLGSALSALALCALAGAAVAIRGVIGKLRRAKRLGA